MAKKLKNGNPQGSNELHGTLSRALRLLEFLKKNTDESNPINQAEILESGGDDHIFGAKATVKKYILALANVLNIDKFNAPKPTEERRLKFTGSDRYYDRFGDKRNALPPQIKGIYYNHVFLEDELTAIINALNTSKAVSAAKAKVIAEKLEKKLASKHYKPPLYKLDFSEPTDGLSDEDKERIAENIAFIQRAISERVQISFEYNRKYRKLLASDASAEKTASYGKTFRYISPHYIVSDEGRLFLYGGFSSGRLSVHRVDMMSEIRFSGKGSSRVASLPAHKIRGLPVKMNDKFKIAHLNGSYAESCINAKFEWSCRDEKTGEFICTALDGAFGNEYTINAKGKVSVRTSLFGMKNFALKYADFVKVTGPEQLVREVSKSVRGLRDKYL